MLHLTLPPAVETTDLDLAKGLDQVKRDYVEQHPHHRVLRQAAEALRDRTYERSSEERRK